MVFHEKYQKIKRILEEKGHLVIIPFSDNHYKNSKNIKKESMNDFNKNIKKSDAILVVNYEKNNIDNYIGINSIMEIGIAFNRKKKIFILNKIPENCKDEFSAIGAIELNGDLAKIKWLQK